MEIEELRIVLIFLAVNLYIGGVIATAILNKMRIYKRNKQTYKNSPSLWYDGFDCFGNWALCLFVWPLVLIISIVEMATDKFIEKIQ